MGNRLFLFGTLFIVAISNAAEIGPSDNLEAAVASLAPGDELILQGGVYQFDGNVTLQANGTAEAPIVVRAKDGERPVLTQATNQHNVIEINSASYLQFRGIAVTGGSHGIRLINSDFITIENCEVYETGDVAISANSGGTYEGLKILRNHIHHTNGTGEGLYLGCNSDACRVANSLIEGNYIHHTNRATVEQGDGIELKDGSFGNVIRDNVVHDTNYPGILVYSAAGNGAANVVERNVVWRSNDNTVQMAADAIFRNNIILGNVSMQSHQSGSPSNILFVHNTVISAGNAIDVRAVSGPVLIANNAIYAQGSALRLISGDLAQVTVAGNVGAGGLEGADTGYVDGSGIETDMLSADYTGNPPIDPFPAPGSALIGTADSRFVVDDDFNGYPRSNTRDIGAYRFDQNGNVGWTISERFKSLMEQIRPLPPTDLQVN
jgi:parallel beta-helix repeat protein